MPSELSPGVAVDVAESTYALRLSSDMLDAAVAAPNARAAFDIMKGTRLTGTTGLGLQQSTGFGYIAWGTGSRQGECVIGVRGTFQKSAYDWLTNFHMAGARGPSGYLVHEGFLNSAQSMLPQIRERLRGRNPSALHLVGHSLGGAIATLLADALSERDLGLKLYTFGAPRSGVTLHAEYLTAKLEAENIFRVYHSTDPVPKVPVFPYAHVPTGSNAYLLQGCGVLLSVSAHLMPQYRRSVGSSSWAALPVLPPALGSFEQAEAWLGKTADGGNACVMMTASTLRMILSALGWILTQAGKIVALDFFGGVTVLDQLAQLLYSGVLQSIRLGSMVEHLMIAALRFMGRTFVAGTAISVAFIRYVLDLLFRVVSTVARQAIDSLP